MYSTGLTGEKTRGDKALCKVASLFDGVIQILLQMRMKSKSVITIRYFVTDPM
jgi:hypothetical protein